jgi:hypothetical protein
MNVSSAKKRNLYRLYPVPIHDSKKRTLFSTPIAIPPDFWNYEEGFITNALQPEYGNAEELNTELRRMYRAAEDIVLFAQKNKLPNAGRFAKKTFSPRFDAKT